MKYYKLQDHTGLQRNLYNAASKETPLFYIEQGKMLFLFTTANTNVIRKLAWFTSECFMYRMTLCCTAYNPFQSLYISVISYNIIMGHLGPLHVIKIYLTGSKSRLYSQPLVGAWEVEGGIAGISHQNFKSNPTLDFPQLCAPGSQGATSVFIFYVRREILHLSA